MTLPLARVVDASLTAKRWQEFSREIAGAGRGGGKPPVGLMALRNARGYFIGLFKYDVQLTLHHGRTLAIDHLVVADEELHAGALPVLGHALRDLARSHECSGIEVALDGGVGAASCLRWLARELGAPLATASLMRARWQVEGPPDSGS